MSETSQPNPQGLPAAELVALGDTELAAALRTAEAEGNAVLIVANGFTVCAYARASSTGDGRWELIGAGEFADESLEAVGQLLGEHRLAWASVEGSPIGIDPAQVTPSSTDRGALEAWVRESSGLMVGRKGDVSQTTRRQVAQDAAWRCQFPGCGEDLQKHRPTGARANIGYFAHIVASSSNGPRGNPVESQRLADDPTNILLLCDSCHRLIDRVRPHEFPVERLREMRRQSIAELQRLLDTLKYPEAHLLAVIGNVTGQRPHLDLKDVDEAVWQSKLRVANGRFTSFGAHGGHLHDTHAPGYWDSLFRVLKMDVASLQGLLYGTSQGGAPRPRIAVFPLHSTSVLLLAGRIVGNFSGTHVFQPHRNLIESGDTTRWAWPQDVLPPSADKYVTKTLLGPDGDCEEACLLVSLTFPVTPDRLPEHCLAEGDFRMPTLEVGLKDPTHMGRDVIRHPDDLTHFGKAVDEAIRRLEDEWRARRIHLFVGAPASAVFRFGQLLQARNQVTYVCYEASTQADRRFKPTIELSSNEARHIGVGIALPLQP